MNDEAPLVRKPITFGSLSAIMPSVEDARLIALIWGKPGCGKTTLASTAPSELLFLMFDPRGQHSLIGRSDCHIMPLYKAKHMLIDQLRADDPFQIQRQLAENPQIKTIVFDSLTTFIELVLENAVSKSKNSTLELPGQNGWTARNAIFKRILTVMDRAAELSNRHLIFTAHEGSPHTNDNGVVTEVPPILSEAAVVTTAVKMSEIWWMQDTGRQRKIAVRPMATRKFVKTRMWNTKDGQDFAWNYDTDDMKGDGISTWFDMWKANGGRKLPLPK